jgi:hypothetical protein
MPQARQIHGSKGTTKDTSASLPACAPNQSAHTPSPKRGKGKERQPAKPKQSTRESPRADLKAMGHIIPFRKTSPSRRVRRTPRLNERSHRGATRMRPHLRATALTQDRAVRGVAPSVRSGRPRSAAVGARAGGAPWRGPAITFAPWYPASWAGGIFGAGGEPVPSPAPNVPERKFVRRPTMVAQSCWAL